MNFSFRRSSCPWRLWRVSLAVLLLLALWLLVACRTPGEGGDTSSASGEITTAESATDAVSVESSSEEISSGEISSEETTADVTPATSEETSAETSAETADTAAETDEETEVLTLPTDTSETGAPETEPASETASEPETEPAPEPLFSAPGGYYDQRIALTLSLPENAPEGTVIRYTVNGAAPTSTSTVYGTAIRLNATEGTGKVVRAACFDAQGHRLGRVVTQTYVYRADTAPQTVYTVMISVAEKDLNAMTARPGENIERPAHVEILTPDGTMVISQDAGLRLFGGSSRSLSQRSFKLIARKDGFFGENVAYSGKGSFAYPLFERTIQAGKKAGKILDKYDSFILRNGGNDSLLHTAADPTNATLLRDGVVNNFATTWAPHVNTSLSQFAVVYINGEYYGILDMRENLNEDYVKRVYGVNDDDVVMIKSELDTTRHCDLHANGVQCRFDDAWFYLETDPDARSQAALSEWQELCRRAIDGLSLSGDAREKRFAELSEKIDMQSLMEYMALNIYVCNTDWPHNNVKMWKYVGEPVEGVEITDGKWRFMTRDMDMAMGRYESPFVLPELDNRVTVDTFWRTLGNYVDGYAALYENSGETRLYPDSLGLQGLLAFCLGDEGFRASFEAYARTLASEAAVADLAAAYDVAYAQLEPCMKAHIQRWSTQETYLGWKSACGKVRKFITTRPGEFGKYLDIAMGMYE